MAARLVENVQSILNCASYSFEDKDTLDHDFYVELTGNDLPLRIMKRIMIVIGTMIHMILITMMNIRMKTVRHQFSLEYMKNVVQFCDERNPKIWKWNNIRKDKFQFLLRNSHD